MSFGTGLHILVALAYNEGSYVPSSALASSIDVNPVTVRRVVGQLSSAGLVETQPGPGGGAMLARAASLITVDDVYRALGEPPFIVGHRKEPQADCVVSACMPRVFERLNDEVARGASAALESTTIQALLDEEID